ncbi:unnamed protein product [Timema podura]|uniref:C2H2-type domain-containing protein n=1 Tax=Timema podura TaxID=61482 RepID=A0ABN7NNP9_TIMPD|nr:unnamed protein product [Timema podura]
MDQCDKNVSKSVPIPISFAATCGDKFDRGLTSIKCESQPFPILLAGVKEEKLIKNDEQYSNFLFPNDLNHKMKEETKEEDQTSLSSLASNVKDCNSVTTHLIIGQENQMKVENITNLPKYESSNKLMEGDELFSLKSSYEESKAKYSTQPTNKSKQSSDDINVYNDTEQSIDRNFEEDIQKNLEKDTQDNVKKCAQNQSEKAVQGVAKIVHEDSTNKDEVESNCYYCGDPSSSKWHSECHKIFLSGNVAAFSCNICKKKFKGKRSLMNHKSTHTGNGVVCEFCGDLLFCKKSIDYHRQKHDNYKSHKCSICFKTYHSNRYLLQHMNIHTGQVRKYLCHICGIFCSKHFIYKHILMHSNIIKYICDICGRAFTRSYDLSTHLISHSSENSYNCAVCNKGTKTKTYLMHHIKTKHPETMGLSETLGSHQKFSCSICNKTLSTKNSLTMHINMHTGEKKYPCKICGKKLGTNSSLNMHKQMHKGEKKFQCATCNKRFLNKWHLTKHSISHTRVRNYKCDLCDKTYMYPYDLSQHKKSFHRKKKTK